MERQKRVAAIHDISGVGRCSLTVALPILSAAGIETSVLPTAVLSAHTGFSGFTYRDLTEDIRPAARHWKSLGLSFDALYSGFLGSFRQVEIVSELFGEFRTKGNLIVVDPVMADHGELYKSFTPDFAGEMAKLCRGADIITPNITEAAFLLKKPYRPGPYERGYIEELAAALAGLGPRQVVLTGVGFGENELGAAVYDRKTEETSYVFSEKVEGFYHGTGDIFASALLAGLLNDLDLKRAAQVAVDFVVESINRTARAGTDVRYGVNFEKSLPNFMKALGLFEKRRI